MANRLVDCEKWRRANILLFRPNPLGNMSLESLCEKESRAMCSDSGTTADSFAKSVESVVERIASSEELK